MDHCNRAGIQTSLDPMCILLKYGTPGTFFVDTLYAYTNPYGYCIGDVQHTRAWWLHIKIRMDFNNCDLRG